MPLATRLAMILNRVVEYEGGLQLPLLGSAGRDSSHSVVVAAEDKLSAISFELYALYHARSVEMLQQSYPPNIYRRDSTGLDEGIKDELSTKIGDARYIVPGWRLLSRLPDEDGVLMEKNGVTLLARAKHLQIPPERMRSAHLENLLFPCFESRSRPGFFVLQSPNGPPEPRVNFRIYINLRDRKAMSSIYNVWSLLARAGLKFTIKLVSSAERLGRTDSGVVYIGRTGLGRACHLLRRLIAERRLELMPETSIFALCLESGLAIAEEPPQTQNTLPVSFGQHRARGLAEVLVSRKSDPTVKTSILTEASRIFLAHGIDPQRPHRNVR
jgi:hypothetical protein